VTDPDLVIAEINALHDAFERWFEGDSTVDFDRIADSLAPDFVLIPPNGRQVERTPLLGNLRDAFGARKVRIWIEHPHVHWSVGDLTLATYEEWQAHDGTTTSRLSTALFGFDPNAPGGLLWRHVHETWIESPQAEG